nr:uncharacterized protein LOC129531521 isoform X1 [Gorilla gorilla gorilla]
MGACLCPCVCVCEHEACACEKQREKLQIKANLYLTVKQANQPIIFFPQQAGGHWWISRGRLRASALSLTLKRLLESSREWPDPACTGPPPHAPLAWGFLSHTIMSSLLLGCPLPFQPFLTPRLNFPGRRQAPKAYHQVPTRHRTPGRHLELGWGESCGGGGKRPPSCQAWTMKRKPLSVPKELKSDGEGATGVDGGEFGCSALEPLPTGDNPKMGGSGPCHCGGPGEVAPW